MSSILNVCFWSFLVLFALTWIFPTSYTLVLSLANSSTVSLVLNQNFIDLAYQGKGIVFRFIIEYSSLMDFGPPGNNRSILI
jgi:hypothetical protein